MSGQDLIVIDGGDTGLRVYNLHNLRSPTSATDVDFQYMLEPSIAKGSTTTPVSLCKAMMIWGTESGELVVYNTRTGRLEASFQVQLSMIHCFRLRLLLC